MLSTAEEKAIVAAAVHVHLMAFLQMCYQGCSKFFSSVLKVSHIFGCRVFGATRLGSSLLTCVHEGAPLTLPARNMHVVATSPSDDALHQHAPIATTSRTRLEVSISSANLISAATAISSIPPCWAVLVREVICTYCNTDR